MMSRDYMAANAHEGDELRQSKASETAERPSELVNFCLDLWCWRQPEGLDRDKTGAASCSRCLFYVVPRFDGKGVRHY